MAKRDYYEILGLSKGASADEIKSSYRKMAMKYHPDKNQGDKVAEQKFKEVSEAYEVLKDPQKKAAYDQLGHSAFQQGGGGGNYSNSRGHSGFHAGGGFGDIFNEFFREFQEAGHGGGRGRRHSHQVKGADLRYNMTITLEEAFKGKEGAINFTAATKCEPCKGTGSKSGEYVTCKTCDGHGVVVSQQGFFAVERVCPTCSGEGKTVKDPCNKCHGSGKVRKERKLSVNIPNGVEDATKIRLAGEGEPGMRGGPAGDLYIFLSVQPSTIFSREKDDLHCKVPIRLTVAALGGDIEVPSIEGGLIKLSIPAGTQSGDKFRLKHKGMTKLRSTARGDLYVHVQVETPVKLTDKQIAILKQFEEENTEASNPESTSFFKKVKDLF